MRHACTKWTSDLTHCAVRTVNAQGDGAAVLAVSVLDAHRNSKYCLHLVAVVHPAAMRMRPQLEAIGYEVRRTPFSSQ